MSVDPLITADDIAAARAEDEANMVDACTITRPGEGTGPFNSETGQYDAPPPVTVYSGKCQVLIPTDIANATQVAAGEAEWTVQAGIIKLPVAGTEAVRVGQVATIDAAAHDSALVGREYGVTALHHKTNARSRRLRVKEAT